MDVLLGYRVHVGRPDLGVADAPLLEQLTVVVVERVDGYAGVVLVEGGVRIDGLLVEDAVIDQLGHRLSHPHPVLVGVARLEHVLHGLHGHGVLAADPLDRVGIVVVILGEQVEGLFQTVLVEHLALQGPHGVLLHQGSFGCADQALDQGGAGADVVGVAQRGLPGVEHALRGDLPVLGPPGISQGGLGQIAVRAQGRQ